MSQAAYSFTYSLEDVNNSIRRTNVLLRAANAVRHAVVDIRRTWEKPNIANFMWTLVQISRAYNSLRRLTGLISTEVQTAGSMMGLMKRITYVEPAAAPTVAPIVDLRALSVRVDAFRDNIPMGLNGVDISGWPEEHRTMLQALMEDDAQVTVDAAKALLAGRILHPKLSTGFLESSIHWQPQVDGVRIVAGAPYSWWVERGHDSFMGHWYMRDAVETARVRLPARIQYELNGLIFGEP